MPRLPKYLQDLIPELIKKKSPMLGEMEHIGFVCRNTEKYSMQLYDAWFAFLSKLYASGTVRTHLTKLEQAPKAAPAAKKGRRPNSYNLSLRHFVESDAVRVVSGVLRALMDDTYRAAQLLSLFSRRDLLGTGDAGQLFSDLVGITDHVATLALNRLIVEHMPQDNQLLMVPSETYAVMVFQFMLEEIRKRSGRAMFETAALFKKHAALLSASVAASLALRRCLGVRALGVPEAFLLRQFAREAALGHFVNSWWQWLVTSRPAAVANQPDRTAAVERLFFKTFIAVQRLTKKAAQASPDGRVPGIDTVPVLLARTEPRIDLFLQDADEVTGDMAWLLATRAPQAAWLEAAKEGRHVEPVQRWRERYERGDTGVWRTLASMAPPASRLQMAADRFSDVLTEWAPFCRWGMQTAGLEALPDDVDRIPQAVRSMQDSLLTVPEAAKRVSEATRLAKAFSRPALQPVAQAPADPLVEKFFSALEQASSGALPEPDVAVMQDANQQVYQPPEEDPDILEALKPVDPAAVFGEDYVEGDDAVMPVADGEGNDAVMQGDDGGANRLPNVRSVDALSVPDDIGDDWR